MKLSLLATRSDDVRPLISESNYHLKEVGMDHVVFSTQITNRAAIRVGEHLGYKYGKGEYVFRLLL